MDYGQFFNYCLIFWATPIGITMVVSLIAAFVKQFSKDK